MDARSQTQRLPEIAELTLLAPIRRGTIDGADGPSCIGRLKRLLRALKNVAHLAGPEAALIDVNAGPAEPTPPGHLLRLTIFEPEHKLRLELGFDPPQRVWMPALPRELGALLDLILCNCKGYVAMPDPGEPANEQWLRTAQAEAQFFSHSVPALVDNEPALRALERLRREDPDSQTGLLDLCLVLPRGSVDARRTVASHPLETVKAGLQVLAVLHRLTDVHPPDGADGAVLLRAAHELLRDLRKDAVRPLYAPGTEIYQRFAAPIRWFAAPPLPA
jgi:hypothetical protein